jgi:hypothetical protein
MLIQRWPVSMPSLSKPQLWNTSIECLRDDGRRQAYNHEVTRMSGIGAAYRAYVKGGSLPPLASSEPVWRRAGKAPWLGDATLWWPRHAYDTGDDDRHEGTAYVRAYLARNKILLITAGEAS